MSLYDDSLVLERARAEPPCVKLIIDPGALSKPKGAQLLRTYLTASADNNVLLTDFALGEAFNGANASGLRRTFEILAGYLSRIEVLKSTPTICRLLPGREALRAAFVDELESNRFRTFCHDLFTTAHGIDRQIEQKAEAARRQFAGLVDASELIRQDIERQLARLPPDGLKVLRKENRLTPEMGKQLRDSVVEATVDMLQQYGGLSGIPDPHDVVHSFPLRFVLANYVLGLHWGVKGGVHSVDAMRLRNDVTDTSYVAYASLFDGLITADIKMAEIHGHTRHLASELFGAEA